ncbi:MAG TPA: FAD-dependent monooxygenase [Trebonia sp.]|nr:FAD-dependent monooxygenase [Trebonia sp.]
MIGAGIGGLAAIAGLLDAGWDVTAFERAPSLEPVGAGLGLAPNGLRALDALGLGDTLRADAVHQELGMRRPDGRWLIRSSSGRMLADRFGDPIILVPRARLIDALAGLIPPGVLSLSAEVTSVSADGRVTVAGGGELTADLVVAADGIRSPARAALFPGHPGLTYSGFTTWRFITPVLDGPAPDMSETWGPGTTFGIMPMAGGRVYCYAAALAPPGTAAPGGDELATLRDLFGGWHPQVGSMLGRVSSDDVLRNDVSELARPLPSYRAGRVVLAGDAAHPMTPNLGQGACQALEDAVTLARFAAGGSRDSVPAVLDRYSASRLPRTSMIVKRSHQASAMYKLASPPAVALRDAIVSLVGKVAPDAAMRGVDPIFDWRPPAPGLPGLCSPFPPLEQRKSRTQACALPAGGGERGRGPRDGEQCARREEGDEARPLRAGRRAAAPQGHPGRGDVRHERHDDDGQGSEDRQAGVPDQRRVQQRADR